jgi:hypothetical protein
MKENSVQDILPIEVRKEGAREFQTLPDKSLTDIRQRRVSVGFTAAAGR